MTSSDLTVNSSFNLLLYSPIFKWGWSNFTKHVSAELEPCPSQLYLKWNMILTTFAYHYLSIGYYFPQWSMKCLSWIPFWIGVPTEETAFVAMFSLRWILSKASVSRCWVRRVQTHRCFCWWEAHGFHHPHGPGLKLPGLLVVYPTHLKTSWEGVYVNGGDEQFETIQELEWKKVLENWVVFKVCDLEDRCEFLDLLNVFFFWGGNGLQDCTNLNLPLNHH